MKNDSFEFLILAKRYTPVLLTLATVASVHYFTLRNELLQDLISLADFQFFWDVTLQLAWATLLAGVSARLAPILFVGKGFFTDSLVLLTSGFRYVRSKLSFGESSAPSPSELTELENKIVDFLNVWLVPIKTFVFIVTFYEVYCGFSNISLISILVFGLFCLAYFFALTIFAFSRHHFDSRPTVSEMTEISQEPEVKSRFYYGFALALVLLALVLALVRADTILSGQCVQIETNNSNKDCVTIVGKSGAGVFVQFNDGAVGFYPFDQIKQIATVMK